MSTNQKSIDWYNAHADEYTAHVRNKDDSIYHSLYEKPAMYKLLPDLQNKSVLSLGCGSGEDSCYLKKQGAKESVGIDISEKMIEIAKKNSNNCLFKVMDMEHLDFPDNHFDFAYSSLAIHYIEDWTQVLKEVYRVIKPDSFFLFSCNHPVSSALEVTEDSDHQKIKQFAKIKDKTDKSVSFIGNYLSRKSHDSTGGLNVTTWSKSFGEISSEIKQVGFLISDIVEPMPSKKMKSISSIDYETLVNIPDFAIFKLYKK